MTNLFVEVHNAWQMGQNCSRWLKEFDVGKLTNKLIDERIKNKETNNDNKVLGTSFAFQKVYAGYDRPSAHVFGTLLHPWLKQTDQPCA